MNKTKKNRKRWRNGLFLFLVAVVCQSPFSAAQAAIWTVRSDRAEPTAAPVSGNQEEKETGTEEPTQSQESEPGETKLREEETQKTESENQKTEKTKLKDKTEEPESRGTLKAESEEEKSGKDRAQEADPKEEKSGKTNAEKDTPAKAGFEAQKPQKVKLPTARFCEPEENPNEELSKELLAREAAEDGELPEVKPLAKPFEDVLKETQAYILDLDVKPDYNSQWFSLGLARSGMDLKDKYFNTFYENMAGYIAAKGGKLHRAKYSEYSKAILSLTAMGIDAQKVNGYNLFSYLADFTNVKKQGFNGPIWALMALKSHPDYEIPKVKGVKEQTTEEGLVNYLLEREVKEGGWTLKGETAEVDITGMTIQALSSYYQKEGYEKVTAAVDRAVAALSKMQNAKTGGYATMGADNVESCVQVVVALCSIGVDPRTDGRFIKSKNWTIADLMSYHKDGSGFMHVKPGGASNGGAAPGAVDGMATEQGHYAMVAYQRLLDGKTFLYDMSDVTLREGWKVAPLDLSPEETVTPTPKPSPKPTKTPESTDKAGENIQNPTVPNEGSGTAATPAPTAKTAAAKKASVTAPKASPAQTAKTAAVSANSKKQKKEAKEDSGGWNFEGAAYADDSDGWDFAAAEEVNADEEAQEDEGKEEKTSIPPFDRAVAGGIIGAAAFEGFKSVFQKKRGRKI